MPSEPTSISPPSRRRLSGDERRASFMRAASSLIREKGLEGLTMEGLAAYCGVNKALPYRHFANRDDLLVALYEHETCDFDRRLALALEPLATFADKVRALVLTWYEGTSQGRGTPELTQARTQTGQLEARRRARMHALGERIADLIQESFDIERDEARLAARVLLAGSQGLAEAWRLPGRDHSALNESFITMSIGAVEAIARR
jgi:AcrR family transcriptional regulator